MTIRCGMSGDVVKRIEEALAGLKLYGGPIDSSFGGGLESAVKSFQRLHALSPSGLVDAATWALLFPGEPSPPSPFGRAPLSERCLALTGSFETGKYHPDCFCSVTGDFDGMGISFGVLQWNVGQGSLQPIFKEMFEKYADVSQAIFHEHFNDVKALGSDAVAEQLAFCRSIQVKGQVRDPWLGMLVTLGRTPECQGVQAGQASGVYSRALEYCQEFNLTSERAVALLFDIVTQNGSIGAQARGLIQDDFAKLSQNDPGGEVARLCVIANRVADIARPAYVNDVRMRKLAVANGAGTVHGIVYDLADMFNITLNPFGTAGAAIAAGK
jgi:hypothetical protein